MENVGIIGILAYPKTNRDHNSKIYNVPRVLRLETNMIIFCRSVDKDLETQITIVTENTGRVLFKYLNSIDLF